MRSNTRPARKFRSFGRIIAGACFDARSRRPPDRRVDRVVRVEEDQFATFVRAALARAGVKTTETDLAVIRVADSVYGPDREALMSADLSAAPLEHDLDPSRPPTGTGRGG
jgi:hypothetical protein